MKAGKEGMKEGREKQGGGGRQERRKREEGRKEYCSCELT